jgi:hypothetical protein
MTLMPTIALLADHFSWSGVIAADVPQTRQGRQLTLLPNIVAIVPIRCTIVHGGPVEEDSCLPSHRSGLIRNPCKFPKNGERQGQLKAPPPTERLLHGQILARQI